MRQSLPFAALGPLLAVGFTLSAAADRGVWFWNSTELPSGAMSTHGSEDIVGVSDTLENQAVTFLTNCGVTRLYGSYKNRPVTEPWEIRPWNAKLAAAGIESQLLISGFEPADPTPLTDPDHTSLVNKVIGRLIDFNNTATLAEQFKALHLDLEPQSLNLWSAGLTTAADRRAYLDDLLDAYLDIRVVLDTNGYAWIPIYADLPPTWDKMPLPDPADGKIGWTSTTDRDDWFAAIDAVLEGVSLMTFSKDTFPDIDVITDYERDPLIFGGETRVAIQPKVGAGELWPTYADFLLVLNQLDSNYGKADLENYAFWRHFKPILATSGLTAVFDLEVANPVVIFTGVPGHLYLLKHSSTLDDNWKEVARQRTQGSVPREMRFPVKLDARSGFWRVEEWNDEQLRTPQR